MNIFGIKTDVLYIAPISRKQFDLRVYVDCVIEHKKTHTPRQYYSRSKNMAKLAPVDIWNAKNVEFLWAYFFNVAKKMHAKYSHIFVNSDRKRHFAHIACDLNRFHFSNFKPKINWNKSSIFIPRMICIFSFSDWILRLQVLKLPNAMWDEWDKSVGQLNSIEMNSFWSWTTIW